jgi:hypothetical protein
MDPELLPRESLLLLVSELDRRFIQFGTRFSPSASSRKRETEYAYRHRHGKHPSRPQQYRRSALGVRARGQAPRRELELVDIAEYDLPLLDEPIPAVSSRRGPTRQQSTVSVRSAIPRHPTRPWRSPAKRAAWCPQADRLARGRGGAKRIGRWAGCAMRGPTQVRSRDLQSRGLAC